MTNAQIRPALKEEAKERQLGGLKQFSTTVSPKLGERFGESAELAAKQFGVGKTAIEEMVVVAKEAIPIAGNNLQA